MIHVGPSNLGYSMILNHIQANTEGDAIAFFSIYGGKITLRWPKFWISMSNIYSTFPERLLDLTLLTQAPLRGKSQILTTKSTIVSVYHLEHTIPLRLT